MRETLEFHERGDLNRRGIADLRQVVSSQVHEHDVLRQLLRILQQLGRQAVILGRIHTARRDPAIGYVQTRPRSVFTRVSGDEPTTSKWPPFSSGRSRKYMYGEGLTVRKTR